MHDNWYSDVLGSQWADILRIPLLSRFRCVCELRIKLNDLEYLMMPLSVIIEWFLIVAVIIEIIYFLAACNQNSGS